VRRTAWDELCVRARVSPGAAAILGVAGNGAIWSMTYQELKDQSEKLGAEITKRTAPGTLIALDEMTPAAGAVAMMAAQRAGRAFLPLNTEVPVLLRREILADARPALLLTQTDRGTLRGDGVKAARGWTPRCDLDGVAYVLYTSGSTGRPKGIMVAHEALMQRLHGLAQVPGLREGESITAITALSFDISLAEILLPLTVGGIVISAPAAVRSNREAFVELIDRFRPDVIQGTPSFWRLVLAWGWRGCAGARIWCGGETLTPSLAERMRPKCAELWNLYGPTEATIWATAARIVGDESISLGDPLPGSGLLIEDDAGHRVTSPGRQGEIWLYGAGLMKGYLDHDELTEQRFAAKDTPDGRKVCYRTGDLGRLGEDGGIEFLGRTDHQIKLRGHRIELGEIEAVLEECPGVSQAVVLVGAADQPDRAHLAAFVVIDDGTTPAGVRRWVAQRLPPIMRPSRILPRQVLPRTTAGKVDRIRLTEDLRGAD